MNNDLDTQYFYYHKNRLHLSLEKTSYALFHLNIRKTSRRLKISLGKFTISYCETPKYFGVTLDRYLQTISPLFAPKICIKICTFVKTCQNHLGLISTHFTYKRFCPCIQYSRILRPCVVAQCPQKIIGHIHQQCSSKNHGVPQATYL